MSKISVILCALNDKADFNKIYNNIIKNIDFKLADVVLPATLNISERFMKSEIPELIKSKIFLHKVQDGISEIQANNEAVNFANGEILVFLDSNTSIPSTFAEKIAQCFELNQNIITASPIASFSDEFHISKARNYSVDMMNERLNAKHKAKYPEILAAESFCFCARKSLFQDKNGFDTSFKLPMIAKKDFAIRLKQDGYKNILIDNLYVYKEENIDDWTILKKMSSEKDIQIYEDKYENYINSWYKTQESKNPTIEIEKEMFPIRRFFYSRRRNKSKLQVKIFGIKFSFDCPSADAYEKQYKQEAKEIKKDKPIMLVIEYKIPEFDKNAGDKSIWHIINTYLKMGFKVIYVPNDYRPFEPYSKIMRDMDIDFINDFSVFNRKMFKVWLKYWAKNIDCALLVRPYIAIKYIDEIKKYKNIKILYYGQDLHFLREQRDYELTKNKKSLKNSKKYKKMEEKIIKEAKMSYFPSVVEKEIAKSLAPKSNVEVVPVYMYKTDNEPNILPFDDRKDLLFIGGFKHKPNVDGVLWFIDEVFNKIKKEIPNVKFNIVGSNPTEDILKFQSENINVLGFISDDELSKLYKSTKVVVAPLRFGAGMKGKVVEALYNKCPIVTTSIGAEGINNLNNAITIADDAKTFAQKVIELYLNKELNEKNSNNSFKIIENQFSDKIMQEVLQKGVL